MKRSKLHFSIWQRVKKLECIEPIQPGIVFLLSAQLVILWDFY